MKRIIAGIVSLIILAAVFTSCAQQPATITMIDSSKTLVVGKTYNIQYNLNPPNSNEKLSWTSSDEEIATVDSGTVTALKAGETEIKVVTQGGNTAVCNLTVKDIDITKVAVDPSSVSLKKGDQETLTAKVYPAAAEGADIEWSSSNTSVASVSADGVVTAVGSGTASISATATNGKTGSATVTVKSSSEKTGKATVINNYYGYAPSRIAVDYSGDFVFSDSSSRILSSSEVNSLNYSDTQKAINEIYARHGHKFSSSYWRNHFNQYSWYRNYSPKRKISQSDCSSIERSNLNKLIKHRNKIK